MSARWLAAGLLLFTLSVVQACGNPGTRCTTSSECPNDGVCQAGFCADLSGPGQRDGAYIDGDDAGQVEDAGVTDAGQDDAGQLNNGRG